MSGKIFLNYRRDDSRGFALTFYLLLAQFFPREQLFMDVGGHIKPGDDFVEVLEAQISACEIMIVVIGPQWLNLLKDGRPRIADPNDIVHTEIATALKRKIRVIPVLVDGASMPGEGELPEPLKALARRNAVRLNYERFEADVADLVSALREVLGVLPRPASAASGPAPHVETVAELAIKRTAQQENGVADVVSEETQRSPARNCFVIRTSEGESEWIWQEIQQGRLRQGWGLSGMRLPTGEPTPEKMRDWCDRYYRRANEYWTHDKTSQEDAEKRYWILYPMTEIQADDRIIIPHMPIWEADCIAIVEGPYEFDDATRPDPQDDDLRHVIPLKINLRIIPHNFVNADAQNLKDSLPFYRKAVNRIQQEDLKTSIENLIKSVAPTVS